MFASLLLSALMAQTQPQTAPPPPMAPAETAPQETQPDLKPLSFHSTQLPYRWDTLLPLDIEVDGLKLKSIFFNRRQVKAWPLKGADFGARAQIEVTNTSTKPRTPGFAVAVFDAEHRLLGVASGGAKVGNVGPGSTETFDLNFSHLNERLPLGTYFYLSLELREE